MRQVFSSARIENVEGVAKLLRDHGIDVSITNGRSYRGRIRGNFSYRDQEQDRAGVWVVRSEDQPKARELLREAGLLDSARSQTSYLPTPTLRSAEEIAGAGGSGDAGKRRAFRYRVGLIVGLAISLGFTLMAWRRPAEPDAPPAPAAAAAVPAQNAADDGPGAVSATPDSGATSASTTAPASIPTAPTAPAATATTPTAPTAASGVPGLDTVDAPAQAYRLPTPRLLAGLLVRAELSAQAGQRVCLRVDGAAPAADYLAGMGLPADAPLAPAAGCNGAARGLLRIAVGNYRTDGSGVGTVHLEITDTGPDDRVRRELRKLSVAREGEVWRVTGVSLD
jgi:hypothetical protein